MLRRTVLWAAPFLLPAPVALARQKAIDELVGDVTARSFARFSDFLSDRFDRIVGLKVAVSPSRGEKGLDASVSGGHFAAYLSGDTGSDFKAEVVANSGYRYEHGAYVFDGFFLVKSGGMHQGVISIALEEVSEAQVRLASRLPIKRVQLR